MATFTVIAVLVTPPEEGVIVMVEVLGAEEPPPQPATSANASIAPAIPSRVRKRRALGIINNSAIAKIAKMICRSDTDGGTFMDSGGAMKAEAVNVPVAVAPGDGAAFVVGTAHAEIKVPGVHANATGPVNPPNPVTVTAKVPIAPLATVTLEGADTEKSQAVPVRPTDCGLPLALSVTVIAPVTGPTAPVGAKTMLRTQGVPAGEAAMVMGKLLPHELEAIEKPLLAVIAEMLSTVVVPGLLIVRFCPVLVVVRSWPGNVRLVGLNATSPAVVLPVPASVTCMG